MAVSRLTTGVAIGNDLGVTHLTELAEQLLEIGSRHFVAEVAAIQFLTHVKYSTPQNTGHANATPQTQPSTNRTDKVDGRRSFGLGAP